MKKKLKHALTAALLCFATLMILNACRKDNKGSLLTNQVNEKQLTEKQSSDSSTRKYDITEKLKSYFPYGITNIQDLDDGIYLAVEKTKTIQTFIITHNGHKYYGSSTVEKKPAEINYEGVSVKYITIKFVTITCTIKVIHDEDTGSTTISKTCKSQFS